MILQLIDDHSRLAVASHVALGETTEAAIAVLDKAVAARGVPQRLLSDDGVALNLAPWNPRPVRRAPDGVGRRTDHRQALHADQPGQERALPPDALPVPGQAAARRHPGRRAGPGRAFDVIYNTERPHQGLPGRVTPQAAWEATAKAEVPRPKANRPTFAPQTVQRRRPTSPQTDLPAGTYVKKLMSKRLHRPRRRSLHGRRTTRLPARPHRHRGRQDRRRRPRRRDSHRARQACPRCEVRRQRQTPRHAPQKPWNVTEVLTQEPSPMS